MKKKLRGSKQTYQGDIIAHPPAIHIHNWVPIKFRADEYRGPMAYLFVACACGCYKSLLAKEVSE